MTAIILAIYFAINISFTAYLYAQNSKGMKTTHVVIGVLICSFLFLPIMLAMAIFALFEYFKEYAKRSTKPQQKSKNNKKKHK